MQCDARTRNRIINHLFGHLHEFQHVNQPTSTITKLHALIDALRESSTKKNLKLHALNEILYET